MQLEAGQVAVITGGASGIGLALAEAFADRGLAIVLSDIDRIPLAEAARRFESRNVPVLAIRTDVSNADEVQEVADRTLERFGHVDVICNNAGVGTMPGPVWEIDPSDWTWVFNVNLWGVINGLRSFVPLLVKQGHGHVVNTASAAGISVVPFLGPYTATKHALVGISESLHQELQQLAPAVGVTILCPGVVSTRINDSARNRPAELSPTVNPTTEPPSSAPRFSMPEFLLQPGLEAAVVAQRTLAAIEAGQLHVTPGHGNTELVTQWLNTLMADLKD